MEERGSPYHGITYYHCHLWTKRHHPNVDLIDLPVSTFEVGGLVSSSNDQVSDEGMNNLVKLCLANKYVTDYVTSLLTHSRLCRQCRHRMQDPESQKTLSCGAMFIRSAVIAEK